MCSFVYLFICIYIYIHTYIYIYMCTKMVSLIQGAHSSMEGFWRRPEAEATKESGPGVAEFCWFRGPSGGEHHQRAVCGQPLRGRSAFDLKVHLFMCVSWRWQGC